MKLFTEAEIEHIITRAEASWEQNKLPKSRKRNYLLTLRTNITQGGVIENICQNCMGSGREEDSSVE